MFNGSFQSVAEARAFIERAQAEPSVLGGDREGLVLRLARGFQAFEFPINVCKSVRPEHVQTDEHWTRSWKPCRIARISG